MPREPRKIGNTGGLSDRWCGASAGPQLTLIRNVNIFDGNSEQLAVGQDVLIEGNLINQIGAGIAAAATVRLLTQTGHEYDAIPTNI